jgi:hypothetical protein
VRGRASQADRKVRKGKTVTPAQDCNGSYTAKELLHVTGAYDDAHENISASQIEFITDPEHFPAFTPTCSPPAQQPAHLGPPIGGMEFLDHWHSLQIPLADGSVVNLPLPNGWKSQRLSPVVVLDRRQRGA